MPADIPEPVQRLLDAANGHDTDAFLASFTDDGVVDDWGREFPGAEAIRGWSDREFIGVDVTLDVTGVTASGERHHDRSSGRGQRVQRTEPLHVRGPRRARVTDDDPPIDRLDDLARVQVPARVGPRKQRLEHRHSRGGDVLLEPLRVLGAHRVVM